MRQGDSSEPDLDLCSLGLVDTTGDKEGRAVLERQARFTNYDMSQLDLTTARGFSLYTALTSTEQGRGAPRTTPALCSTGAGGPTPWLPHPKQLTVSECCEHLEVRDYPMLVNETLQERFKDRRKFDAYAAPLLKIANPRAHPLILSTLLRAKWYEVMNTETGGASSRV